MTTIGGAEAPKITVPPSTPGPVPSKPAISVMPAGTPSDCAGIVVPRVSTIAPWIRRSCPAQSTMLPSVTVSAAMVWMVTLRPALTIMLPLVVVIAAARFTSRPEHSTMLPLVAVIDALTLMSRTALSRSVVVLGLAVQAIASLTKMSPLPVADVNRLVVGGVPLTVLSLPGKVLMTMLLVTSSAESAAPEMFLPASIVKASGSISQVPVVPLAASVVMRAVSAMLTEAA
ncbi:hypothetical protein, partial [Polymorphobacter multimanifer]|uniref:hypothetical protein n=1 Tax=Polymorphobacter multimanifer TaxID=1070431 RepID=UPI001FB0B791